MERNSTERLPGVDALLHMVPASVSYPSFPPALALQTQNGHLYPVYSRPSSAGSMNSTAGCATPNSSSPSPHLGMEYLKLRDSQVHNGHDLHAMAVDTLASASSTPATPTRDLAKPRRKIKAASTALKAAKERTPKKSAREGTPTPGVMHTALANLRITKGLPHPKTELFRRAISHELTASALCPLGLDSKSAQPFATRLSQTSWSSVKNDNGLSDNQSREVIARAISALVDMVQGAGYTLEDVYARMKSDETTARVTASAAAARRESPIEAKNFPDVHPEDIAKLAAHGFVTYDEKPKKHGRGEDESEGETSDRSTKTQRSMMAHPTTKSKL